MKRVLCLLLCMMLLCAQSAFAAELYDSQPEKMTLQFLRGSGIKGSMTLTATGDAPWAAALQPISGVEMQLRALDGQSEGYQYRMYVSQNGQTSALTEIMSDGGSQAYLQSEFLLGNTYVLPAEADLLSTLAGLNRENLTWYSAGIRMLQINGSTWQESWAPELEPIYQSIDTWLIPYAAAPEVMTMDGEKQMLVRYEVPAADVKAEMKALLPQLLSNQRLMGRVRSQATTEQADLYLHEGYLWYYEQVIDALPLEGKVVLERRVTTMGEDRGMLMTFPVAGVKGLKEITLQTEGEKVSATLLFNDKTVEWSSTPSGERNTMGTLRVLCDEGKSLSVGYELMQDVRKSVDESGRTSENYIWRLNAQPELSNVEESARERYITFDPMAVDISAVFSSKSGDTTPVTLNLKANVMMSGSALELAATMKSASPWKLPEMPTENLVDLMALSAEERTALWQDMLANAMLTLADLRPAPVATMTDLATPTDMEVQ